MFIVFFILISNTVFGDIIEIDNYKLKELTKRGIPIVDIRTKKEWVTTGIIKNSHLISMINDKGKYSLEDWFRKFSEIKLKDNSVIIICAVGGRSYYIAKVIDSIKENITIYNLQKGIVHWIRKNNPTIKNY